MLISTKITRVLEAIRLFQRYQVLYFSPNKRHTCPKSFQRGCAYPRSQNNTVKWKYNNRSRKKKEQKKGKRKTKKKQILQGWLPNTVGFSRLSLSLSLHSRSYKWKGMREREREGGREWVREVARNWLSNVGLMAGCRARLCATFIEISVEGGDECFFRVFGVVFSRDVGLFYRSQCAGIAQKRAHTSELYACISSLFLSLSPFFSFLETAD